VPGSYRSSQLLSQMTTLLKKSGFSLMLFPKYDRILPFSISLLRSHSSAPFWRRLHMVKFVVVLLFLYPYLVLLVPFWCSDSSHFVEESSLFAHCHRFHLCRTTRSFIMFPLFPSSENLLCHSETISLYMVSYPHISYNNLHVMAQRT
jgi:hypothetical protein